MTEADQYVIRRVPRGKRPKNSRPHAWNLLTSPARCLPDFLIIGAQKAGTTSLFAHLNEQSAVWMAPCKECHFFSRPWVPTTAYRGFFLMRSSRRRIERELGRRLLVGEATPYYLFHPRAPVRAARALPKAKIIVLLRDPVERAYSHYRHEVRLGLETLSFEEALDAEAARTAGETERLAQSPFASSDGHRHYTYVARGRYAEQLRRWFEHFDREQFHVEFAERLFDDAGPALARIERFLGLREGEGGAALPVENRGKAMGEMAEATRRRLEAEFAEPNRELAELLGVELPWGRG